MIKTVKQFMLRHWVYIAVLACYYWLSTLIAGCWIWVKEEGQIINLVCIVPMTWMGLTGLISCSLQSVKTAYILSIVGLAGQLYVGWNIYVYWPFGIWVPNILSSGTGSHVDIKTALYIATSMVVIAVWVLLLSAIRSLFKQQKIINIAMIVCAGLLALTVMIYYPVPLPD